MIICDAGNYSVFARKRQILRYSHFENSHSQKQTPWFSELRKPCL